MRAVAYQFASRIPEYAEQIETPAIRSVLENVQSDPPSAFELGVLAPLGHLEAPPGGSSLLCIDALDEAMTLREGLGIVSLLQSRTDRLPSWLKLIATTRDDKTVMRHLGGLRAKVINAVGKENTEDLRSYVIQQLEEPGARAALDEAAMSAESFTESLLQRSEGSFLYAEHVLQGVLRGGMQADELGDLPPGLNGTYERYLSRAFPAAAEIDQIRPVLEVLCAADRPIPRSLLAEAVGLQERALIKLLAPLTPFMRQARPSEEEPQLAFWHKSFYDFLTEIENADSDFGIDQNKGEETLASLFVNRVLNKGAGLDFQASAKSLPDYLRWRGLDHLALCGLFFDGLSDEQVTRLVYCSSWGAGGIAVGGLPTFVPAFVSKAIATGRLDAMERLLEALDETAQRHYIDSGLIQVQRRPDGTESRVITLRATESAPLHRALIATGLAVSVVDQVFAQRGAGSMLSALVEKLDGMHYMAGGLDIAGWSHGLSGYFEDQGYALNTMIKNLKNGLRAQTWKR
ncbi:MAG: hypothetical protein QOJ64_2175 [Acidobacteriota bacterium]|nr:hypothetical protein [Acidobacteriota bacterium]